MPTETITIGKRTVSRWVPENSEKISHPDALGVAYLYPLRETKFAVVGYRGLSGKHSFHFSFRSRELAMAHIQEFFASLSQHKERIANRRAEEASQPHTLKPNDI